MVNTLMNSNNTFNFSVVHQNIRSLRENFDKFISNLYGFNDLPSIIFLSEIWIYDFELSLYSIPNYTNFGCCNNNYRAGGACVFYNSGLNCSCESVSLNSADIIKLSLCINKVNYIFICVYRLQFVPVSIFVGEFSDFINNIRNKNVIIVGDFNIDILNFPPSSDEYMFLMSSNGLLSLINKPTRITNHSSTCIDHCFVRSDNSCRVSASLYNLLLSDHHLISVILEVYGTANALKKNDVTSNACRLDNFVFSSKISTFDFSTLLDESDPVIILSRFLFMVNSISDSCISNVIQHKSKIKLKPWISFHLINLMAKKNKISKKCKKHPANKGLQKYFLKLCQKVDDKILSDKFTYYHNRFQHCCKDSKKTWSVVNQILGDSVGNSIDKIMSSDSVILTDCKSIANDFGFYFSNIVPHLRTTNCLFKNTSCPNHSEITISENFFINPVDVTEVVGIINGLKSSNSRDILGISPNMLKYNTQIISPILVHFINQSFLNGVIPDSLKTAVVIPLFKKGDKLLKDNYRPISLQPTIMKILEKALKLRVDAFFSKYNILNNCQYGFRSGRNTESALIDFLNGVHTNLNVKKCVGAVFIDIKRAFDMVDHKLLLLKLYMCGFRGVPYQWFKSYLSNRFFKVKIDNSFSMPFKADFGVPQGSVLGPVLFLVYINSIFHLNLKGKMIAFADDMALSYYGSSASEISSQINSDMKIVRSWFDDHSMVLSDKTKIMFFRLAGDPYSSFVPNIVCHVENCNLINCSNFCIPIEHVYNFKYLGLHLDANLNWKIHFQKIKEQLNFSLRAMYMLRQLCPSPVLLNFYYACVESRLSYGLPCWGGVYMNTLGPLYILQKYIVRVMFFKSRRDRSWPIFLACKILPLQHLYVFKVLKLFFSRSGHRILRLSTVYDIRNNYSYFLSVPAFISEAYRKYYLVSAPTFFNRLPLLLRAQFNNRLIMNLIKDWLFENGDIGFMFIK